MLGVAGAEKVVADLLRWLARQSGGKTSAEVRHGLKYPTVKELNRILYNLERQGVVRKDDSIPPRWTIEQLGRLKQRASDVLSIDAAEAQEAIYGALGSAQGLDAMQVLAGVTTLAMPVSTVLEQAPPSEDAIAEIANQETKTTSAANPKALQAVSAEVVAANGKAKTTPQTNATSELYKMSQKRGFTITFELLNSNQEQSKQKRYTMAVSINGIRYASATSLLKRDAKHRASEIAIQMINQQEEKKATGEDDSVGSLAELNTFVTKHKLSVKWHEFGSNTNMPPFRIAAEVDGRVFDAAVARSKKAAKRAAAALALRRLKKQETNSDGDLDADEIASAVHAQFNDLVGAEESMRPGEVLAGFLWVERANSRHRIVAISHGNVLRRTDEHPMSVARRALLRALYREVADDHQTFKNSVLLQPRPPGCPEVQMQIPNGTEVYLYISSMNDVNKTAENAKFWIDRMAQWTTLGVLDQGLCCYLKPIRLNGICMGSRLPEALQTLYSTQASRAREVLGKSWAPFDFPVPTIVYPSTDLIKTCSVPRRAEGDVFRVYWSVGEEELGIEDAEGRDASSGRISPISFSEMADRIREVYRKQGLTVEQKQSAVAYAGMESLISNALTGNSLVP